jgi:hypothetical protein
MKREGAATLALKEPTDSKVIAELEHARQERMRARKKAFAIANDSKLGKRVSFRPLCARIMKELEQFDERARPIEFGRIIEQMLAQNRRPGRPARGDRDKVAVVLAVDYVRKAEGFSLWVDSPLWPETEKFLKDVHAIECAAPTVRDHYFKNKRWVHQLFDPVVN